MRTEFYREQLKKVRLFLRENPQVVEDFNKTGRLPEAVPEGLSRSILLRELLRRARERELRAAIRRWREDHPEEYRRIMEEVLRGNR